MSRRIALIIGNNAYQDKKLACLKAPEADVHDLASVLREPGIGNFDAVETITNQSCRETRAHIRDLFNWKKRHDLLLLYFLGHVIQAESGQLYLATVDSSLTALNETAIPASYITEYMDLSFSRQQILLLDCYCTCLLAPESGHKVASSIDIAAAFKGKGQDRVVLAAADTCHYILKQDRLIGEVESSVFTDYLIRGLKTGEADIDKDGQVGMGELYKYVYDQLAQHPTPQKPRKWSYSERDKFIIARNPNQLKQEHPIKWDLIFGAIMAPLATIIIGGASSLSTSVGMAGLLLLIYALLYWVLE